MPNKMLQQEEKKIEKAKSFGFWKSSFGSYILNMEFESSSLWGSLSRISWYFLCDSLLVGSAVVGVFALSRAFDAVRRKCGLSSKN